MTTTYVFVGCSNEDGCDPAVSGSADVTEPAAVLQASLETNLAASGWVHGSGGWVCAACQRREAEIVDRTKQEIAASLKAAGLYPQAAGHVERWTREDTK